MKTYLLLPAIICSAVVSGPSVLHAEDAAPVPSASQQVTLQDGKHHGNPMEMMAKKLDLTADQQAKLKPIFEDRREKMKALREDSSLTQEQKKEKAKALFDASNDQIKAILTPDQLTKYEAFKEEMKNRREQHQDKAPAASATP